MIAIKICPEHLAKKANYGVENINVTSYSISRTRYFAFGAMRLNGMDYPAKVIPFAGNDFEIHYDYYQKTEQSGV